MECLCKKNNKRSWVDLRLEREATTGDHVDFVAHNRCCPGLEIGDLLMTNSLRSLRRSTFAPNPNTVSSHQPPNADENSIFSSFESTNLESASMFAGFAASPG